MHVDDGRGVACRIALVMSAGLQMPRVANL
jgi:hypothetical protein